MRHGEMKKPSQGEREINGVDRRFLPDSSSKGLD